eukprot:CAMPEP_0197028172 /NCGR_PEP_ID=MMETSP1384-20130603/7921_1 /TAXON_ID=29189 /ORGANISM="Ammonia sp." /LENGTH=646 /DNA_ID=CAMNT_0042457137 /DNA_START=39 /DNA_END=1979 /DNA_ORIENTATION=-
MAAHSSTSRTNGTALKITPILAPQKCTNVKLQSQQTLLSLIKRAESKRHSKHEITTFLRSKGVPQRRISAAFSQYYHQHGLYEITFTARPLGFCVIKGHGGKNAIVSSIEDKGNAQKGMTIASRIYSINGKPVKDLAYKQILKEIAQQQTPFAIVFKQYQHKPKHDDDELDDIDLVHSNNTSRSRRASSISSSCYTPSTPFNTDEYQWDCSPFYDGTQSAITSNEHSSALLTPSVSPLITNDVYVTPTDDEDDDELTSFQLPPQQRFIFGHKDIQRTLNKEKLRKEEEKQILLLGCAQSGKSTIMKQIRRLFGDGYSEKDRVKFIPVVHEFAVQQMVKLMDIVDERKNIGLNLKALKAKQYIQQMSDAVLDHKVSAAIKYLWQQECLQQVYQVVIATDMRLNRNARYFWDDLDRILDRKYLPNDTDILRVPHKPSRVTEEKYSHKHGTYNVINLGGQRSDWKKWISCFSHVDAVIFVASLDCYNMELSNYAEAIINEYIAGVCGLALHCIPNDVQNIILKYCNELGVGSTNAMDEQLNFFQQICDHRALEQTKIVLCLNKFDLFYKKCGQYPITECPALRNYYRSLRNADECVEYIRDRFFYSRNAVGRYMDCWYMDASDHKSIHRNFEQRLPRMLKPPAVEIRVF